MKIIALLFYLLFTAHSFYTQEIDLKRVTGGFTVKYLLPKGDMGDFWNNSAGAGIALGYLLQNSLSLEGEISYSKINPKNNTSKYPDIHFIEFSGGVKYSFKIGSEIYLNLKPGIENCMFIFNGPAAELVYEENRNESEFGFFIVPGLQYNTGKGIKIELNFKILSILSSPEKINIFVPGITVFIL